MFYKNLGLFFEKMSIKLILEGACICSLKTGIGTNRALVQLEKKNTCTYQCPVHCLLEKEIVSIKSFTDRETNV
jgi:hypothetical protein